MKHSIKGTDLKTIGFTEGPALGAALRAIEKLPHELAEEDIFETLTKVLLSPGDYVNDPVFAELANVLLDKQAIDENPEISLKEEMDSFTVFGKDNIEQGAFTQMEIAMKLPITVAGSLMPDAHQGYGLPIGGVLATNNAVIPYGVGVDIGCRMCLSIFDIPESHFYENEAMYKRELIAYTKFGAGNEWRGKERADHAVMENADFKATPFIQNLFSKAWGQLGTSGGGNHFVEWGIIEMLADDVKLGVPKGKYLALLSHSGSRGFGATLASYYTKIAKEKCKLPQAAKNLAYLGLDTAEGQEYWLAMNLAGDYASACHDIIHQRLTAAIGGSVLAKVENHHNFAWKEKHNGQDVIVHRKGATPAGAGVLGIIPGSMTAPGFLVRGRGVAESINSASHGAGRQMSRTQAIKTITREEMKAALKDHGVTLIGAGLDEAPGAYKDINMVMNAQSDLVDILARFKPKMVRMADDGSKED